MGFWYYSAFTETGATQTMKSNQMAELKQQIPVFSIPANQMLGTRQRNLNLFFVMLTQLRCRLINCQAQTVNSFACLRVQEEFYATFIMGSLFGLENTWKQKLRKCDS